MTTRMRSLVLLVTPALFIASAAVAQTARPLRVGVGGGMTFVTGEDRDFFKDGFNFQGRLQYNLPALPLGIRLDVMYHKLPSKDQSSGDTLVVGDLDFIAGALNAVYTLSAAQNTLRPYITGGLGLYRAEAKGVLYGQDVSGSSTDFGITGGVGLSLRFSSLEAFAEARIHNIFSEGESAQMYPLVLGLMF